jgi:hypothetical protein
MALHRPLRGLAVLLLAFAAVGACKSKNGNTTPSNKGQTDPAKDPAGGKTYGGVQGGTGSADPCAGGW